MNLPKIVTSDDDATVLRLVGDDYRILITGAESGGQYFVFEADVPPDMGPPAHIQTREDEAFYVLDGEITFSIGSEKRKVSAGGFVHVPRGVAHSFKNETSQPAKVLIWFSPAGIEKMFEQLAESFDNFVEVGKEYGVQYLVQDDAPPSD
jgi:quercetin dioxygenase-like cupin family protein